MMDWQATTTLLQAAATHEREVRCFVDFHVCLSKAWLELISPANIAQAIGALASMLSLISSMSLIAGHWKFNATRLKKPTVRLLFVVPIFALDAWACLMLEANEYDLAGLLTCFREIYEAIALLSFMELVLTILGGTEELAITLEAQGRPVEHFWPLRLVLSPYRPGAEFLAAVLAGIFQYIVTTLGYFSVVLLIWLLGRLGLPPGACRALQAAPGLVKAASCAWALNCLVLFAHEVRSLVPSARLVSKFVSIKGIVFFTFWQGLVIALLDRTGTLAGLEAWVAVRARRNDLRELAWDESQVRSGLNDLLLCLEVLGFSVLHWFAYPVNEEVALPATFRQRIATEPGSPPLSFASVADLWDVRGVLEQIARLRKRSGCERGPRFAKLRDLRRPLTSACAAPLLAAPKAVGAG